MQNTSSSHLAAGTSSTSVLDGPVEHGGQSSASPGQASPNTPVGNTQSVFGTSAAGTSMFNNVASLQTPTQKNSAGGTASRMRLQGISSPNKRSQLGAAGSGGRSEGKGNDAAVKEVDDPTTTPNPTWLWDRSQSTPNVLTRLFSTQQVQSLLNKSRNVPSYQRGSDTVKLEEFLYTRGFLEGTCSDITIIAFGTRYRLHRLILDRSPFFSSCFNGGWAESTSPEITLSPETSDPNIQQHAFELALARLYGHVDREKEDEHALPLLAAASYLELQDLAECCVMSLLRNLKTSNIAAVIKFITNSYYGPATDRLLESAKALLYRDGWEMDFAEWDGISGEIAAGIAGYEGFYVPTEYLRYCFVKDLVDWRLRRASEADTARNCDLSSESEDGKSDDTLRNYVLETIDEDADVKPLQDLLENGIYYIHMPFEELQKIMQDRDVLGRPVVSEKTIKEALWQQVLLRQKVLNAPQDSPKLGITKTEIVPAAIIVNGAKTPAASDDITPTSGERRYYIPTEDSTTVIGDCPEQQPQVIVTARGLARAAAPAEASTTTPTPATATEGKETDGPAPPQGEELCYSTFPPFRFSAEFKSVRTLSVRKRVYSKTVFYAGSYWNIYIQKVKSPKNVQLGVYLHRAKDREGSSSSSSANAAQQREQADTSGVTTQIALLDLDRHNPDDTAASDLTVSSLHPADDFVYLPPSARANTSAARSALNAAVNENTNPALTPYTDSRPMIQTYFKIFSPSRKGKMLSMFSSGPDSFNFSQSWGWKSSSLILEEALIGQPGGSPPDTAGGKVSGQGPEEKDAKLRFMVVLGNI